MNNLMNIRIGGLAVAMLVLLGSPAFAQIDLAGIYNPFMH